MSLPPFPPLLPPYNPSIPLREVLQERALTHPFHLIALAIFLCAITHTLLAHQISHLAHFLEKKWDKKHPNQKGEGNYHFGIEVLRFLSEVEIIFAIWVIPLLGAIAFFWNRETAVHYLNTTNYNEALFVIVIMVLASTKPILHTARFCLKGLAGLFGNTVMAWWLIILTFCPILGSFITEPGAMTLGALLLKQQFYCYKPSKKLAYATLGLLFVNISIGGVLTNFAAPPILMVASKWNWSNAFMFRYFGIKSVLSILVSNLLYFAFFFRELRRFRTKEQKEDPIHSLHPMPLWVIFTHICFLVGIVFFAHYSIVLIGLLFLFIAFHQATAPYQEPLSLKGPVLVGSFLAGLVVHGGLQSWWIEPIIKSLSAVPLMITTTALTAFNDNALMTYLSSLIQNLSPSLKYAVVSGAVAGGGLTVIANAPNPAGQFLLKEYFEDGISPLDLFLAALLPTLLILGASIFCLNRCFP